MIEITIRLRNSPQFANNYPQERSTRATAGKIINLLIFQQRIINGVV